MNIVLPAKPGPRTKPLNAGKRWTPEEEALLRKEWLADEENISQLSSKYGRTEVSIAARLEALTNLPFEEICGFEKELVLSRKQKVEAIASLVADYRDFELGPGFVSQERIEDWVSQFSGDLNQAVIISEMHSMIRDFYWSRDKVDGGLVGLLDLLDSVDGWTGTKSLLDIQKRGDSQRLLVSRVNKIATEKGYDFTMSNADDHVYVYFDDVLYTGNRFYHDLVEWIEGKNRRKIRIFAGFLVIHRQSLEYQERRISELLRSRNIVLRIGYVKQLDNHSLLVPEKPKCSDVAIQTVVSDIERECLGFSTSAFRTNKLENTAPFSSDRTRSLVEQEFFRSGSHIVSSIANPKPSIRPMGFNKLCGPGFGAYTITFMNISNNCPLALWFGASEADEEAFPPKHPLNSWYPLFPRRQNDIMATDRES